MIGQPETPRVWIKVKLNGVLVKGLIDSGAEQTLIHETLVCKVFGARPHVRPSGTVVRGIGESTGVRVMGEIAAKVELESCRLSDMSLTVVPHSSTMSSPLIFGMEFLRLNKFVFNPGERILSRRETDGSGLDWIIDSDGNPLEMRVTQAKCVLTEALDLEPHSSVDAL